MAIKLNKDNSYNILIIGVGGTGSHLISFLAQMIGNNLVYKNQHRIVLVDGDEVESKNLRTQKFLPNDVGLKKAEVLSERYENVFGMNISYVDRYITCKEDLIRLLNKDEKVTNLIVSCVDNNKARAIIDDLFNSKEMFLYGETIIIDTGNSSGSEELTGQTVVAYRDSNIVKLPSVSTYFPQVLRDEPETVPVASCGQELLSNIQNIGANITSACTVFNILNNIISFNTIPGDLFMFNANKVEVESMLIQSAVS